MTNRTTHSVVPTRLAGDAFAVSTEKLVKRFKAETALDGVDLQAPEGSVYLLAGGNGAGKSTLLRILLDLVRADSGRAEALGLDPRADGPSLRAQLGYVPESTEAGYRWMRVGQLLQHHGGHYGSWDPAYADQLCRVLDVRPHRTVGHLSKGQSRRLQLVMALAHRPPLLLLDEPTDGLDPVARDEVMGLLSEHLADTGCTVLVSTHLVYEVERLADHVGVLSGGRLVAQTSRDQLQSRMRVYRADGPDGWVGPADLNGAVLRRGGVGREVRWTVWGDEADVVERFRNSGGVVRDVSPLTLDEAVVTLLRPKDPL